MKLEKIEEKKKGIRKFKLDTGEDVKIDLDSGHVEITVAPNNYYHTFLDTENTFTDHKGRKWKVKE